MPYQWAGFKVYDLLAGTKALSQSYFMTPRKTKEVFPTINTEGLWGSLVMYDGQHNDSRTNVQLAMTAASWGAVVANGVECTALQKDKSGKINGVEVTDIETGRRWNVST